MKHNYIAKILVFFSLCLGGQAGFAQTFEQILPPPPAPQILPNFEGVQNSSIAFADVDRDGDQDVLITGGSGDMNGGTMDGEGAKAILYLNDGTGNYTEDTGTPFEGVQNGSIAFADIDGDGDQDVLITGGTGGGMDSTMGGGEPIAKLYVNDGFGNFTELLDTPFEPVQNSSIAFADVDGDNDQDVLITGFSGDSWNGVAISNLYLNDGNGNYTKDNSNFFEGVQYGSIAFADVDRDGDQDVLITGIAGSEWQGVPDSKLYLNNGFGNFVEDINNPFPEVANSSIAFADIDGDNDQDILITGRDNSYNRIAKLYKNDGAGHYSESTGTLFEGVENGAVAFADVDGDNDQDVVITGSNFSKLYKNDGSGNYTEDFNNSFAGVEYSSIAFADIDGDNDQDLLITGGGDSHNSMAILYVNMGAGNYVEPTGTFFTGVQNSSIAFADIDGDGDRDVLITGQDKNYYSFAKIYENDGSGNYSEITGTPFPGVSDGSIAFADIDDDGDQDVLITGRDKNYNRIAKLYRNDGAGNYSEVPNSPFAGVEEGSIAFADIDKDGDQDVLITGRWGNSSLNVSAKLYKNDGSGNYSEVTGTPFTGVQQSSIAFADIDKDGYEDVLITGRSSQYSNVIAKLYKNDGSGNFSEIAETPFLGVSLGSIAFADVDGDNDQDLLITGYSNTSNRPIAKLYKNDGAGSYIESTEAPFEGVQNSSVAFADVDGDRDQDVLITGYSYNSYEAIAKLYKNDGVGNYSEVLGLPFPGVQYGSLAFADIDSDNDQDVLITGYDGSDPISIVYRNTSITATPPVVDESGPVVQTVSPAHQTTDVPLQPTLSLTFDEVVELNSSGILTLEGTNGVVQTYDLSVQEDRGKFIFSEDKLTLSLNIDENLPANTTLSVGISNSFVKDESGNGNDALDASSNAWTFTTTKLGQTITFTEISAKTYGDDEFILGDEKTNKDLVVTYTAQDPDIVSISGNRATILKAGTTEITATQEGDATHFAATPVAQTLIVDKAAITVAADGTSKIYGEEDPEFIYKITAGALVGDDNFTGELSRETGESAGTYAIEQGTLALSNNYNLTYQNADFTINKAETVITAEAVQTFIYDGTIKNVSAQLNHTETALTYAPQQGYTNAGIYPVTISAEETDNYLSASKEVSLVIENAEITGVAFAGDTFTYDGTAHSIFVTGLTEGATVEYADNGQINAGTYTVTATVSQENYNDKILTTNLVIEKAEAVITAEAVQTFIYDGTVKNVVASLNHSETALTYAPQQGYTNAGTYEVTISSEETDNYLSASKEVSLVIENAEITGVAFAGDTFTYDGTPHSIFVTGLPEGATVTYADNGQINAGTYTVTATVSQDNHNDKILTADLIIEKAEAVITAEAVQTFIYDGTVKHVAASLNHSETALTYAPQQGYTDAGTYDVTISAEETDNYLSASKEVSLVIENAEITGVAFAGDTFTYDGTQHSIFVTGLPEGASVSYENNDQTAAGTYEVTATISQENYNDKVLTADLVIDKAQAIITADAVQTFTYDGTVKNVAASLNHSETALIYNPQQGYTDAGTYPVTISAEATSNYEAASKEVSLKIENAEITGVAFEGETFTYDGTAHSIFVTGLPEGATVVYADNGQTNTGTYEVTATISQDNYNDQILTADLVIEKAEAVITAEAVQTFTYDGTVKNVAASLNHSETALTYAPQQGYTAAGTYPVTISAEATSNYEAASKEVSLKIENAEITGVAFEGETFTYDGTAHSIFVTGLPEGATVVYADNGQTNAGTYEVTATISQDNYNDQILTADLVIEKAEAVITAEAVQTFTYDGTVKNVAASLNHSETKLTYDPQQGYTNAGIYPVTISAEETSNYEAASEQVSLVIDNAEITGVAFEGETFTYDGTPHSIFVTGLPEGATVKYDNNGKINAGTYIVTATVSQENYNDQILTANLVIEKAEAVITADAVQTFTYDGTVKKVSASLNHSETALTYTPQQGYINAGTYPVTVTSAETANYEAASEEVSLVIENAEITGVAFAGDTFTYDGTPHSIFVTGLPEGATVEYADNGQINAGTYKVTATVNQDNYNDKVLTADLVIEKAEAIITAEAVQTFIYDGTVKNVSASLNHSETALTYAPQQGYTGAGTYEVTISSEETENYLSASKEVSLKIENAEITGVAFEGDTFTYDGTVHSIFVTGLPEGATVVYTDNGQINAGAYTVTATVSQENYNDKVLTANLVIEKAEAVITADAVQTFTYDGTVKNVAASLNHSETGLTYTPQHGYTDAGTYPVTISAKATSNYEAASKEVSLKIENAEITGVAFAGDTFTYDGTPHSIFVTGLPEGATVEYAENGQINAGTYKVTATISQDNYNDQILTADLVIKKAEAVITADAVQTFTYDGTVKNVAASLNHSETGLTYTPQHGYTDAGTYPVTISAEATSNYEAASKVVSLKIENAEITGVAFAGETFTYDGTAHSIFVTGLPQGATFTYDNNGKINAGTYEVTATVSQENYNDQVLTADLVIEKAEAVITAEAIQTFTYDGTVKNVVASLNHSETALTYAPQQGYTNAGTYEVTISSEETDNYLSASKEVSLKIENAEITGVAFAGDSFTYDGTAHSIFVTGLPEGATVAYADNEKINAGIYEVTGTVSQENYNDKILTADLVIKKAEAIIIADAVQTFTYNGTVKNVAASLNHSETALTYSPQQGFTDAGTYPVTVTSAETANYEAASEQVSLVIENAEITGVAFAGETFTYDGTAHSIFITGLPVGATVVYADNGPINAGTYTVTATVIQENYNDKVLTANLVIEKAEAIITAEAVQTFIYDGTVKNVSASLNHSETTLTYTPQQGYTNAGTYEVTISSEETDNYLSASREVRLVIDSTEIEELSFEDATFTYDGQPHSLAVNGMPEGASVVYSNNAKVNAGTYTVTATVSQENFNDKVLTAVLTIEKASQEIIFDELSDRNLQIDEDFLLSATSTSGLAVTYSYTSENAEHAASVSPRGFVRLLTAGQISITAIQEGNSNYKAATSVTRMLNIISSEAKLNNVVINGTTYTNPSAEIYYLIGCGSDEDEIQIELMPNRGSSADHAELFTIATPAPGIYNQTVTVTSGEGGTSRAYNIKIEKTFNFEDIIIQKFNNVLLVNNNPETNGGYKFTSYKWFKNGVLIGSGQSFSAGNNAGDQLDSESTYHVEMTTEDGETLRTCSTVIQHKSSYRVVLARNPIKSGEQLELLADFPKEELETMQISIHNLNGTILKQLRSNNKTTAIELPFNLPSGVYILNCITKSHSKSLKFIVH